MRLGSGWGESLVAFVTVTAKLHTFVVGPRVRTRRDRRGPATETARPRRLDHGLEAVTWVSVIRVVVLTVLLGSI
jgi:hypothetical protein